jgi:hypothetical protein
VRVCACTNVHVWRGLRVCEGGGRTCVRGGGVYVGEAARAGLLHWWCRLWCPVLPSVWLIDFVRRYPAALPSVWLIVCPVATQLHCRVYG